MGKSIRIYLADAEVGGIRHAEIVNWTGQALAFPRNKIADLKSWPEIKKQGVYFLLGFDDASGQEAAYIGEAEIVADRIVQHVSKKDFWTECIAFTSKDENLTKSHIKYLESRLVAIALASGRYCIKNSSTPQESGLPRADKDAMDEFASYIRIILGVLGHRVLEPVSLQIKSASLDTSQSIDGVTPAITSPFGEPSLIFNLAASSITAKAIRDTNGFVVLENSLAAKSEAISLSSRYKAIREQLLNTGALIEEGEHFKFTKDYSFNSPSQAASVILGYISGRNVWKLSDGRSLAKLEEDETKDALGKMKDSSEDI